MTPEIAGRIQQIRNDIVTKQLTEEEEIALVAEGLKLFREARGIILQAAHEKATKPKRTKKVALSGEDLLNTPIGASNE